MTVIGEQVKTRQARYWTPDNRTRVTIHSLIQIDGVWAHIGDDSTLSGIAEFDNRKLARKFAIAERDKAMKRNDGESHG